MCDCRVSLVSDLFRIRFRHAGEMSECHITCHIIILLLLELPVNRKDGKDL